MFLFHHHHLIDFRFISRLDSTCLFLWSEQHSLIYLTNLIPQSFKMHFTKAVAGAALMSATVLAHPGHNVQEEALERRSYLQTVKRADLSHCAAKLKARGVDQRNVARRTAALEKARAKRSLKKRTLTSVLATDHNQTSLGYTENTDAATLFSGNNSCILTPEVTQGPYCTYQPRS